LQSKYALKKSEAIQSYCAGRCLYKKFCALLLLAGS